MAVISLTEIYLFIAVSFLAQIHAPAVLRMLWQGNVVSFEVPFEGVKWWWDSDSSRWTVPNLWSGRGESTTYKVGFWRSLLLLYFFKIFYDGDDNDDDDERAS